MCRSMLGRLCIQRNRVHSHATLMQDYFAKVPTCPFLFNGRYRMQRDLFVKIVNVCEENTLVAGETLPDI
jgi:hypothetical protein